MQYKVLTQKFGMSDMQVRSWTLLLVLLLQALPVAALLPPELTLLALLQVRNWTNGPGFLTWSRGQNSHGT